MGKYWSPSLLEGSRWALVCTPMQWRRGQQCQRPSALLKVFSRSGALRTESPGHWVTGGGGNQGPSPVPGHWVTTPPRGRLSPEVPPSRLGAETEVLLMGWGGRRAVSGGYFSLTEDARAERAGQPPPLPTPRKSPPLGGWPPRPGSPPRATYASRHSPSGHG